MDDRSSIPGRSRDFSVRHRVQTGSGAHPASFARGTGSSYPGVKRSRREDDLHLVPRLRIHGIITPLTNISLRGA
jgi:hypothetical protein